jgi:hypothetical protein
VSPAPGVGLSAAIFAASYRFVSALRCNTSKVCTQSMRTGRLLKCTPSKLYSFLKAAKDFRCHPSRFCEPNAFLHIIESSGNFIALSLLFHQSSSIFHEDLLCPFHHQQHRHPQMSQAGIA